MSQLFNSCRVFLLKVIFLFLKKATENWLENIKIVIAIFEPFLTLQFYKLNCFWTHKILSGRGPIRLAEETATKATTNKAKVFILAEKKLKKN